MKEKDSTRYVSLKNHVRNEAANTSFKACYDLLEKYVEFFHDRHLYIGEFPPKQPDSLIATVKRYSIPANYEATMAKNTHRDSIEGIWVTGNNVRMAIVKRVKNELANTMLSNNSKN